MNGLSLKWKWALVLTGLNQLSAAFVSDFDGIPFRSLYRDMVTQQKNKKYKVIQDSENSRSFIPREIAVQQLRYKSGEVIQENKTSNKMQQSAKHNRIKKPNRIKTSTK